MKTSIVDIKRVSDSKEGQVNYQLHFMGDVEGPSGAQQSAANLLLQLSNIGDDRFAGRKQAHAWLKVTPEAIVKIYGDFLTSVGVDPANLVQAMEKLEVGEMIEFNQGDGYEGVTISSDGQKHPLVLEVVETNRATNSTEQENMFEPTSLPRPSAKHIVDKEDGEIKFFFTQNNDGTVSPIFRKVNITIGSPKNVYMPLIRDGEGRPVTFTLEQVKANEQQKYAVKTDAVVSKSDVAKVLAEF